jgi:hypothetical protein
MSIPAYCLLCIAVYVAYWLLNSAIENLMNRPSNRRSAVCVGSAKR